MNSLYKFFRAIFFVFLLALFTTQFISAQGVVSRPTKQTPQKVNNTVKKSNVKLSLATEIDGKRRYFTQSEWKNLPISEKVKYNKIGMVIEAGSEKFMISLTDYYGEFSVAKEKTNGQLPSNQQLQLIKKDLDVIDAASKNFGGDWIKNSEYWDSEGNKVNFNSRTSYEDKASYRRVTNNIEKGFDFPDFPEDMNGLAHFVGKIALDKDSLRIVRHHNKYGVVNKKGDYIVPLKYDAIGNNSPTLNDNTIWEDSELLSVSLDGKWGFVNKQGKEVTPIMYDEVQSMSHKDDYPWVRKEGLTGNINMDGKLVVPIKYKWPVRFYNHKPGAAVINEKDGLIDENNNIILPFKYDQVWSFGEEGNITHLRNNGKFGVVNTSGKIIWPIEYDMIGDVKSDRAIIDKDRKRGFLNGDGELVIPMIYEDPGYTYTSLYGFNMGDVAMVKKDGKYGMIDKSGNPLTPFKYDSHIDKESPHYYLVKLNGRDIYLDSKGKEYASEKEFYDKNDPELAELGDREAIVRMLNKLKNEKKYEEAVKYVDKLIALDDSEGYYNGGLYFYYGYAPVAKDYEMAFKYFQLGAQRGNKESWYFLGWMTEHGQGTDKDISKAIEYYEKSGYIRDSKDRVQNLKESLKR